jgi:hypothetical protein
MSESSWEMGLDESVPVVGKTWSATDFDLLAYPEREIWYTKGADYTIGNADRLYNFNQLAKDLGLTPRQVWYIYFAKHVNAVLAWVKTGKVESEGIEGRLIDIANYAKLGRLIAKQEETE